MAGGRSKESERKRVHDKKSVRLPKALSAICFTERHHDRLRERIDREEITKNAIISRISIISI
jgi:hypothetical protein